MKTAVLETGISDHHKMILSILKHTFLKRPSKTICYRDLENFDQKAFSSYLESKMADCPNSFEKFLHHIIFAHIFSKRQKYIAFYKYCTF